jgi:hypothetical protein
MPTWYAIHYMNTSHFNRRDQILFESGDQCYYCGCLVQGATRYQPDSACVIMHVPRKYGGNRQPANLRVACFVCATHVKKDLDTRHMSVEQVRAWINKERRRMGFAYNEVYAGLVPDAARPTPMRVALAEPHAAVPSHNNIVDEEELEAARLRSILAEIKKGK